MRALCAHGRREDPPPVLKALSENMEDTLLIIALIVVGLIGLASLVLGAIDIFAFAGEQGFIGIAAYVACWVFLGPIIATISVLIGLYLLFGIAKRAWF